MLNEFNTMLGQNFPSLKKKFDDLKIEPVMYAYKWFLLFYAQEFNIGEIMRLWDSLFSFFDPDDPSKINKFVLEFAISIIYLLKNKLINSEMADIISCLINTNLELENVLETTLKCYKNNHKGESMFSLFPLG